MNSQSSGDEFIAKTSAGSLNLDLVTDAAKWLSERLDLTIFGFDVVVSYCLYHLGISNVISSKVPRFREMRVCIIILLEERNEVLSYY